jgi:pimeloyl-ACP methyl ester carboxylesterase
MHRLLAGLCITTALACASGPGSHPVTTDPVERNAAFPAALLSQPIVSGGATMNGIVYVPAGPGPHPTAILLHGFPGDERNLDLAQALRRSGFTVLFFHYRGAWGSEGRYSLANMLDDVKAAAAFAGTPEFGRVGRNDPERIALVGHSMGGFAALTVGSESAAVDCIVSIAGANVARLAPPDAPSAEIVAERLDPLTRPLAGASGASIVSELTANAVRFDTTRRADALATKPVLLVAGAHDAVVAPAVHHAPLVAALREAGATQLTERILEADHAFSPRRIALATTVADWLAAECR